MMHCTLLAWSWFGHGQLTELALASAISQFALLGKNFIYSRLLKIEATDSAIEAAALGSAGFGPSEKEIDEFIEKAQFAPPSDGEKRLARLFSPVPRWVQEEDIHRGNIPKVGEYIEHDSQVRHYMRSYRDTPAQDANRKSVNYIQDHLKQAWSGMHKGVNDLDTTAFDGGVKHLASALHTIEDSYSAGHTQRQAGTGMIQDIYYWPDTGTAEGPVSWGQREPWKGHEFYDVQFHSELYAKAKVATADFILCVLKNLDQDEGVFLDECSDKIQTNFYTAWREAELETP